MESTYRAFSVGSLGTHKIVIVICSLNGILQDVHFYLMLPDILQLQSIFTPVTKCLLNSPGLSLKKTKTLHCFLARHTLNTFSDGAFKEHLKEFILNDAN